jgi:lysophospholipase L1-like esterase
VRRLLLAAGLALGVLVALLPAAAPAVAVRPVYVALGDSYASGLGTGRYLDDASGCRRSLLAYPPLLARAHGYALRFRACAGATVSHVRRTQLDALDEQTAYVTLSVGGNDAGFARVLTTCAAPWWLASCDPAVDRARDVIRDTLPGRLSSLYAAVRAHAPHATVVVVGYPRLFTGEDCDAGTWFSRDEQARLDATADLLDGTIAAAARTAGFLVADPRDAFAGHAVCDDPEWVNGLSLPVSDSFHPNRAGHASGLVPLLQPLLTGAPDPPPHGPDAGPGTHRSAGTRTAPFRRPDLFGPRARRAAERHGIDVERWLRRHP